MADESMSQGKQVFLSAEWRDLVMLNYQVDPGLLSRYVPSATSLDSFQGKTYVSLVGFRFCRTRLLGYLPVPFHTNFDEVNLRFYVHREVDGDDRRGVVFVAEIVPRRAIATTARLVYGENYKYARMRHCIETGEASKSARYEWQVQADDRWCRLSAQTEGFPAVPQADTLQAFITEHYWGYSAQPDGGCLEYHVSHAPWQVWATRIAGFEGDASALYGRELGTILQRRPDSAFVADGSPVIIFKGDRIL
jgi:uncharacterized protein